MALGYARMAWESIPGNETNSPTLSTKKIFLPLLEFEVDPGFEHLMRDDELVNTNDPRPVIPENASPSWRMRTRMYPDVIGFLLTTMLGAPTTTNGDGVIVDLRDNGGGYMIEFMVRMVLQVAFGFLGMIVVGWFSRAREFRADAGAAALSGRQGMIAALRRLQGRAPRRPPASSRAWRLPARG